MVSREGKVARERGERGIVLPSRGESDRDKTEAVKVRLSADETTLRDL